MEQEIEIIEEAYNNGEYDRVVDACTALLEEYENNYLLLGYKGLALGWGLTLDNNTLKEAADYLIESLRYTPQEALRETADHYLNELVDMGKAVARTNGEAYIKEPEVDVANMLSENIRLSAEAVARFLQALNQDQMINECNLEIVKIAFDCASRAFSNSIGKDYNVNNHPSQDDYNLFLDRIEALFNVLDACCSVASNSFEIQKAIYESMAIVCEELLIAKAWENDLEYMVCDRLSSSSYKKVLDKLVIVLSELKKLYDSYNKSNDKYFNTHEEMMRLFNEDLKLREKAEETRRLISKVEDEALIENALSQLKDVDEVLNEYDNAINKLRYSLFR